MGGFFGGDGPQPLGGIVRWRGVGSNATFPTFAIAPPAISVNALLTFSGATNEGRVVASVGIAWRKILAIIAADPAAVA